MTAKRYDGFMASESVIKMIPRLLGPGLNKAGKFPTPISASRPLIDQVDHLCDLTLSISAVIKTSDSRKRRR